MHVHFVYGHLMHSYLHLNTLAEANVDYDTHLETCSRMGITLHRIGGDISYRMFVILHAKW